MPATQNSPRPVSARAAAGRPIQAARPQGQRGFWETVGGLRPGPNLPRAALGGLVLAIVYFALPSQLLLVALLLSAAGFGICAVLDVRAMRHQFQGLKIRRTVPAVVGRNVLFGVTWEIENSSLTELRGELRDVTPRAALPRFEIHPFRCPPGGRVPLTGALRIPERGWHTFGAVWVRLIGRWGLMESQLAFEAADEIKVLPELFASRDELRKDHGAQLLLLDKATRARQHGAGTEFESLQDYREGDDPRRIDWRSTARLQRAVVRRFQIERHRDVMILVDCGRLMGTETDRGTKLDCAIDAGLVLAQVALQSGDRCGMALYDSAVRGYLPPVSGKPSLRALTDTVFAAKSDFRESNFGPIFATLQARQAKRSLIVVLSDVVDVETSELFRASLARLGRRHVVLFAALRTPVLDRILQEPVETINDGARKAVIFRLQRERQLAIQSLRKSGVYVLDVKPTQLTVPLLNQFIELRARNLL